MIVCNSYCNVYMFFFVAMWVDVAYYIVFE